jgi:hypothetical protein
MSDNSQQSSGMSKSVLRNPAFGWVAFAAIVIVLVGGVFIFG